VPATIGAAFISSSAIIVQLAHRAAGTTAFFRCALALPGLLVLAHLEQRRHGRQRARARLGAAAAGVFLGVDLVVWTHAIYDVGAGVATVLGNLQVLFVTAIAWAVLRERPRAQFLASLPVVLLGIALLAGLVGHPATGDHPVAGVLCGLGTSASYALFILVLRRNTKGSAHVAGPLADATVGAALTALVLGSALGQLDFAIPLQAFGWLLLLALLSQTLGWLFITSSLPHLPAAVSSLLLLLQPAASLVLAAVVLSQRPTLLQVAGAVLVCAGVLVAARAGSDREVPAAEQGRRGREGTGATVAAASAFQASPGPQDPRGASQEDARLGTN
jgi:drug/metabolite transporter (DMT)-like permease